MNHEQIFEIIGVEVVSVTNNVFTQDEFKILMETLRRIGVPVAQNTLEQKCYVVHKKGRYKIVEQKEMRLLDGEKDVTLTQDDIDFRNNTVNLMKKWNLLKILHEEMFYSQMRYKNVFIVSHKDRWKWTFLQNYNIGVI